MSGRSADLRTRRSVVPPIDGDLYTRFFSGTYDRLTALSGWRRKIARHALEGLEPGLLLDVGCGTGHLLALARDKGFAVRGADPSAGMLAQARARHGFRAGTLVRAPASRLPFPDAGFDVVIETGALCYEPDMAAAAAEMSRVLKPGGRLRLIDHAPPRQRVPWTPLVALFSHISGDLLHDFEPYFSPWCRPVGHKTLGRGGYMQRFDFTRNS